ncbi:hypothetical protein FSW04_09165 [Baekduia soli]|uniref:Uncharacterized protein n=1 Tax=Baekduia soli TaxID=496014 RepID=A0A5B8U3T0_9ACTN|nr:hypothetical protein [Baekduia soli]QEC47726.1 hypothetical protein FSW04_09165 [Baekduia soli]
MNAMRFLDLFIVVVTAPVAVLLGAPALGTLVGAAAWVIQRLAALAVQAQARRTENVRAAVGLNLAAAFGRAWLVALTILAVGLAGHRNDGLAAAVLTLVAFTIYFATSLAVRSLERSSAPS